MSLFFLPCSLLASDGEKQLKKSTALLSANLILTQFDADFAETPPNADFMYDEMTSTPDDYVKRDEARAKLQEAYQDRVRVDYRQKVDILLARIAEKNGVEDAFDAAFRKKASSVSDNTLKTVREKYFTQAFESQRKKVCDEQLARVTCDMFPSEEAVDSEPEAALIKKLTQRLAEVQKFPVFEENNAYLRDLVVTPVVQDAYRQRTLQGQFLEGARSIDAITPEEFAAFLEKALQGALPEFKSDKLPKVYNIFPSVQKTIPRLAADKAKLRYMEFLQSSAVTRTEADVKTIILADLQRHHARAASRDLFRDTFMKQSIEEAPKRFIEHFRESRRSTAETYLKSHPIPPKEMRSIFETIFDQKQQKIWEAARNSIVSEQIVATYPSLEARIWTPKDAFIEEYTGIETTQEGRILRDEMLKNVASSVKAHEVALEETRHQAGTRLDEELARGSFALRRQRRLVLASSNDIVAEASARLTKTKPEQLADELFNLFLPRIQAQWPDVREKEIFASLNPRPGNADSAYLTLFPSVEALLRQLIREIIQKLAEPKPVPPEEPKPETPPQPETPPEPEKPPQPEKPNPPEKPEIIKLVCAFTIDMKDNEIIVQSNGDIAIDEAILPVAYDAYKKQESKTLKRIADQFAEQLETKAQGRSVELTLNIFVKNGMIYYQLVSRLRDRLDYRLKKLRNNEKMSITLTDKME